MAKQSTLLVATMTLALILASGAAVAAVIDCTAGVVCIGTDGDDTMTGSAGDDTMKGKKGDDVLYGRSGKNILYGDPGDDQLYAGKDPDTIQQSILYGGVGNDHLYGGENPETLYGNQGGDYLAGRDHFDTYVFEDDWGKDSLKEGEGSYNKINALDFNEVTTPLRINVDASQGRTGVRSGPNTVTFLGKNIGGPDFTTTVIMNVDGGQADDYIAGIGFLSGNLGDDTLLGSSYRDFLDGNEGQDALYGRDGWDLLRGSEGGDALRGGEGNDHLGGDDGNDTLYGGPHPDTLWGDDGDDTLYGGKGADSFEGYGGDDTIHALDGDVDDIDCGEGNDTVFFDQDVDTLANCEHLNQG